MREKGKEKKGGRREGGGVKPRLERLHTVLRLELTTLPFKMLFKKGGGRSPKERKRRGGKKKKKKEKKPSGLYFPPPILAPPDPKAQLNEKKKRGERRGKEGTRVASAHSAFRIF